MDDLVPVDVFLLAGRRPDPADADVARFPIANAIAVRERLRALMITHRPTHLVCSAACGADLLALDIAGDLGVQRHVVLPFDVFTFRESSVTDRPGSWGAVYDRILNEVKAANRLTVLDENSGSEAAYASVNDHLLSIAQGLEGYILAVAVWEGSPRGEDDLTLHLFNSAAHIGAKTAEVITL